MASSAVVGDKYRDYLSEEDLKNTTWRFGPPNYDDVNKVFEEGRTHVWPEGSLEERVQRLLKTWEMELVHKANPEECNTLDHKKFRLHVNGNKGLSLEEIAARGGGYNVFLQTSLPEKYRIYNPDVETTDSSKLVFQTAFRRGFAIEVLQVYSGPPKIVYSFRHWGYVDGPFKGYAPTGEIAQFYGMGIFEIDEESNKIVKVELFFDGGELLGGLVKGGSSDELATSETSCPFMASK
nr:pathogen-related protein-like [Ipomoea batatas]